MNLAFLASIAWMVYTPKEEKEIVLLAKDEIKNGGVYIIQNEADSHVLLANHSEAMANEIGNVIAYKWERTTKTTWLMKTTSHYPVEGLYTLTPTDNAYNPITLVFPNGPNTKLGNHYWNISYAGHSFGDDKWLLMDYGINGTFQGKCLENNGFENPVVFRPCNKMNSKQRWKFCLCTPPNE